MNASAAVKESHGILKNSEAAFLGVSPQTLRNKDEADLLDPICHPVSGDRHEPERDVAQYVSFAPQAHGPPSQPETLGSCGTMPIG